MTSSMQPSRNVQHPDAVVRSGWTTAAAVILLIAGAFNLIHGLTLLNDSSYFEGRPVYDNITFWAWAFVIWGALQAVAGAFSFSTRSTFGPLLGLVLATIGAVIWMFLIFAAPFSALVGIVLNLVVVYGLVVPTGEEY